MTIDRSIDPAAIEQVLSLGGRALLVRLIGIFKEVGADRLADAQAALESDDLEAVHRELHSIRSSSGNLGCTALSDACLMIEHPILNDETADFSALMQVVSEEMANAQAALRKLL